MCPHCGKDAPVVYRGALPYCTACGKVRPPLDGPAVHLTGKPARIGGQVTRVFGWVALAVGAFLALLVGSFFQWLFAGAIVGWVLGSAIFVVTLIVAFALLKGGGALRASGARAEARTFEKAVFALAESRGGILSSLDVAQVLGLDDVEADRYLTEFAKKNPERVRVELDDAGTIVYQFPQQMLATRKTEVAPSHGDASLDAEEAASRAAVSRRVR
jgi:hypothetical protein